MKINRNWSKGEMSRTIVMYCIKVMTCVLVWSVIMKTLAIIMEWNIDLSDVLTFTAATFGGELLLLAFKRVFTKNKEGEE